MFKKILIANRGEIAVRVARTARRMGVKTVAVFSDADRNAPHVRACDEAVHIGPAPATESYLRADQIVAACQQTNAEAVHPGYGFLSENSDFVDTLDNSGIVFIGPTSKTIQAMGSKSAAKDLMEAAGVPTTPGYQGGNQSVSTFKKEAKRIGYPVLLKATAGGGGKGMRLVNAESELEEAIKSAQREAKSAFGDDRFLIEKYIARARHVEVQIFGDGNGNVIHMFERDCSIQRRHQKVIEEAPAPNLPSTVRDKLLQAGVDAGKAVQYRGAGTVEFLYDGGEHVFFMEMNTRLQVEHPVSEMITGLDFVEWQLRIAAGEPLPLSQEQITETGHAFEARLYAENPDQNFVPSVGTLTTLRLPDALARIDSGVEEGQAITPYYDPMIAKIITAGPNRNSALSKLRRSLEDTRVAGVETNARFLHALTDHEKFIAGNVSTGFIDDQQEALFDNPDIDARAYAGALLTNLWKSRNDSNDPWDTLTGFRLNRPSRAVLWLDIDGKPSLATLNRLKYHIEFSIEPNAAAAVRRQGEDAGEPIQFSISHVRAVDGELSFSLDGAETKTFVCNHNNGIRVFVGADHWDMSIPNPLSGIAAHQSSEGSLIAPMPGVITLLSASPGDAIPAGGALLVMEAMKMEHTIKAPFDGMIRAYKFNPGDQIKDGDLLVEFEEKV